MATKSPLPRPVFVAREISPLERRAWLWLDPPQDEAEQLALLLVRWAVDPVACGVELFRIVFTPYQVQMLLDVSDVPGEVYAFYGADPSYAKRQVLAPSGHGLGKTRVMAFLAWWQILTRKFSKVLVTAPTSDQLTGQLWGEIRKLYRRAKQRWPTLMAEWLVLGSSVQHVNPDYGDWGVLARTARPEKPEALQGAHGLDDDDPFGQLAALFREEVDHSASGGILVLIEEASGVDDTIREVLEGALSEEGARLYAPGNPTRPDGWFADALDRTDRYAVHHLDCRMSNRDEIYTVPYRDFAGQVHQLRIRGFVRPGYWLGILAECDGDEDKDRFRVRVRGQKPRSAFDACIRAHWIDAAQARMPDPESAKALPIIGLDFGLTSDKHALAVRKGFTVSDVDAWLPADTPDEVTLDAVQRAQDAVAAYRSAHPFRTGGAEVTIIGDSNGVGRGAMETLSKWAREMREGKVIPNLGVKVIHLNTGARARDNRRYNRLRDEMWAKHGRGFFSDTRCSLPNAPGLKTEICTPGMHEDGARIIRVESKKEVMARTSQPSGNRADAILHTLMVETHTEVTEKKPHEWLSPVFKKHFQRLRNQHASSEYIN